MPLQPSLLIASPQMKDPFFERSVVLVWHHDEDGAIGVVINRPLRVAADLGVMPVTSSHKLIDVLVVEEELDMSQYEEAEVSWGGPVDTDSGTILTSSPLEAKEGWILPGGIGVTRSHDALVRLVRGNASLMLCLGYAGWGPGQLDREITEGGWLYVDPDKAILFDVPFEDRWERAIEALGISCSLVWMQPVDE